MKLADIFEIDLDKPHTMYESFCVEVIDLDPSIKVTWDLTDSPRSEYGYFEINNQKFRISIEQSTYPNPINIYATFVNVGFQRLDDNGRWVITTSDGDSNNQPINVLGTVAHNISLRLAERSKKHRIDAIIFGMTNEIQKRDKIYSYAANKLLKDWPGTTLINGIKTPRGIVSIIFTQQVPDEQRQQFTEYIRKLSNIK